MSDTETNINKQLSGQKIFDLANRIAQESLAADGKLIDWLLRRDTWSPREAMLLILGVDPDSTETIEEHRYGNILVRIVRLTRFGTDDPASPQEVRNLDEKLANMMRAWESGSHPSKCAPAYFIRWAVEKGFPPRWYEWACKLNLLDKESIESRSNTVTESAYIQPKEEPKMRVGKNSRAACMAWCAYMATEWKDKAATRKKLAELIQAEANRRKYRMQRGASFSIDLIVPSIPQGTTGTRKDNRRGGKTKPKL